MARRQFQKPSLLVRDGAKGKEWYLRYRVPVLEMVNGRPQIVRKQKWDTIGLVAEMSPREAERRRSEILAEVNGKVFEVQAQVKVKEFLRVYRATHLPSLAEPTQKTYEQWLRLYVEPAFGEMRLVGVGPDAIQAFLNGLPLAPTTKNSIRGVLASVWGTAKRWGYFRGDSPVTAVRQPKGRTRERVLLTPEQLRAVLANVRDDVRLLIELLVATGMRISEALGLRWGAVDGEAGVVLVEERLCRGSRGAPKSEAGRRPLVVDRELARKLEARRGAPEELVFRQGDGKAYQDNVLLANYLTPVLRRLGLKRPGMGWHTFRRMHLTYYARFAGDAFATRRRAGHASVETTQLYVLEDVERERVVVEGVARALRGPTVN